MLGHSKNVYIGVKKEKMRVRSLNQFAFNTSDM